MLHLIITFKMIFLLILEDENQWVKLVGFYGISIIVGYVMPNPVYAYIKPMICKRIVWR